MDPLSNDSSGILAQARTAWPQLTLDEAGFAAHVARYLPGAGGAALHAGDLFLAWACAQGDPQALAEFDRLFVAVETPRAVAHLKLPASTQDELKQLVRQRLLVSEGGRPPRIAEYSGRGPLSTWVRVATVRTALNLRRGQRRAAQAEEHALPEALVTADPELAMLRDRYRGELSRATRDAFVLLTEAERTLLRLHVVEELSLDAMALLYRVGRSSVHRRLAAARERVLQETRGLLVERLKVDPAELDSLLELLRSQVDVSIRTALDAPTPPGGR